MQWNANLSPSRNREQFKLDGLNCSHSTRNNAEKRNTKMIKIVDGLD